MICDKFNLNIDDLLNKDIKEVKGESETKKKINKSIDDFLNFVTDTINMFFNMSFKSKIKSLFEQIVIATILILILLIIYSIFRNLFLQIFSFIPRYEIRYYICNVLNSIIFVFCFISSITIIIHIFKIRYLNYFNEIKNEPREESNNQTKKIKFEKKENRIIIRDPNHGEYKFINSLFKLVILIVKMFLLFPAIFICFMIICLFALLVISFMITKTGLLFIGIVLSIISTSIIAIIFLLMILNFIFNRKNNKKIMITTFIVSLIILGVGNGLISKGTLDFEILNDNETMLKTRTVKFEMNDNFQIRPANNNIKYIETKSDEIKIKYTTNELCDVKFYQTDDNGVYISSSCEDLLKIFRRIIKNINNKKIIPITDEIFEINIHTSKSNIAKIKSNIEKKNNEHAIINLNP